MSEVARVKDGAVVPYEYDGEGQGFEHQTQDDIQVAMLLVTQALTPQVANQSIPGIKPGLLMNNVTEELAEQMLFVPAVTNQVYIEWVPRDKGGGFVAVHDIRSDIVKAAREAAAGSLKLKHGENDLVQTFQVFGVLCNETDPLGMVMIPFSKTKIRVYKQWMTRLRQFQPKREDGRRFTPPLYAHLTKISTVKQKSPKGEFFNYALGAANEDLTKSMLAPDDLRFLAAKECYELTESQRLNVVYDGADASEPVDDKLPF